MASTGSWATRERVRATAGPWLLSTLVVMGLVVVAIGVVHARQDAHVRSSGTRADATILARAYSTRLPDRIRVAFATGDGRVVDTRVAVQDAHAYPAGVAVPLRYDREHPSRVVLLRGQESRLVRPLVLGGIVVVTGAACLVLVALQRRRGRPVALRGSRPRAALAIAAVAVALVLVSGVLPSLAIGAAPTCPSPPAPSDGAATAAPADLERALAGDGLPSTLSRPLDLASTAATVYGGDPGVTAMLASDGFTGGWFVQQGVDGHPVSAYALQLADRTSARRFEAQRLVLVCRGRRLATYDPGVPASDGTYTDSAAPQNRIAVLRGSRLYLLVEHGDPRRYPGTLRTAVARLAASAR